MTRQQLDLFAFDRTSLEPEVRRAAPRIDPAALGDAALIAAIQGAGLAAAPGLAAEAGRRRLAGAVAPLDGLCRRFIGFGADKLIPEQAAALEALAKIGGAAARQVIALLIAHLVVQGPTLAVALSAAARLGSSIPSLRLTELLKDSHPTIRARACRCVRSAGPHVALLIELLDDLHREVATAAAIALGHLGRPEARPLLLNLLRRQPSAEVVEALGPIVDEEVIVALGRIAREIPEFVQPVLDILDQLADGRAASIAEALRNHHAARNGLA